MAAITITINPQEFPFKFFYPRRPSRPLPRRRKLAMYSNVFRRDALIAFQPLPAELWALIHDNLPTEDLKTLALVNGNVGSFARHRLARKVRAMRATATVFRAFFTSHLALRASSKIQSLTLRLSPYSQAQAPNSTGVLAHWLRASRGLNHLRELSFLGTDVRYYGTPDVLGSLPPTARLRLFFCEDDNLLNHSMDSLRNHCETLEDFGGFFDADSIIPRITPDKFLQRFHNIHTLDIGARFLRDLRHAGSVKYLSVRLEWQTMLPAVRSISALFGTQVHALRLERTPVDAVLITEGFRGVQELESPLFVCAHLDMPALRYLEVRDSPLSQNPMEEEKPRPAPDLAFLGNPEWATWSDYEGIPNLDRLSWRPRWALEGAKYRTCADAFVSVVGDALPVLAVWMSLEENPSGIWDTWTRIDEDFQFERQCVWDAVPEDAWKRMVRGDTKL